MKRLLVVLALFTAVPLHAQIIDTTANINGNHPDSLKGTTWTAYEKGGWNVVPEATVISLRPDGTLRERSIRPRRNYVVVTAGMQRPTQTDTTYRSGKWAVTGDKVTICAGRKNYYADDHSGYNCFAYSLQDGSRLSWGTTSLQKRDIFDPLEKAK